MDELLRTPVRTLHELARRGTMAAVAEATGFTPGAVSQQVAALERAVGVPLVVRAGRRVLLTDAGRTLAERAGRLVAAEEEALEAIRGEDTAVAGALHLGIFGGTAAALLPAVLAAVGEQHPELRVTSREVDVDDAAGAVRRGDVDVAFGLDYSSAPIPRGRDVELVQLRTERFSVVSADGPRAPARRPVDLAGFADADWVLPPARTHYGEAIRSVCRTAGFEPRAAHELLDTVATLTLAAHGAGLAPATPMMLGLVPGLPLRVVELVQELRRDVVLVRREADARRDKVVAVTATVRGVVQSPLSRAAGAPAVRSPSAP
ncbi:MAG TPA: LysR family transcriptional regulator [Jiangellales bacterium]|nr:LysR family transcriptional regulator [Jiangellales bacterium]